MSHAPPNMAAWNDAAMAWLVGAQHPLAKNGGPARIGLADVDRLRTIRVTFDRLDSTYGGAHARNALVQYLRTELPRLLRAGGASDVRRALFSAAGESTQLLVQRYSDAPAARLTLPTAAGFAAAKAAAWHDRAASRDLWDLWALAVRGHLTAEAADLFARLGPTNRRPDPATYTNPPGEDRWRRDLAGQVRLTVTAAEACTVVRERWEAARHR